jgi:hypothetical protein
MERGKYNHLKKKGKTNMRKWLINLVTVKPVILDGFLYVLIALFTAMEATFSNDDSFKYVNPFLLFWAKTVFEWALAACVALKMFRSTSYADHLQAKSDAANANTQTKTVVETATTTEVKKV